MVWDQNIRTYPKYNRTFIIVTTLQDSSWSFRHPKIGAYAKGHDVLFVI